jgi:hypothetical protein
MNADKFRKLAAVECVTLNFHLRVSAFICGRLSFLVFLR